MCRIKDYAPLYTKAAGELRHQGLNSEMPGFEILKVAIVVYKVRGNAYIPDKDKNDFFDEVESSMTSPVPSINPVVTERHPIEQWILETLREKGIEDSAMSFIEDMATLI